MVYRFSSPGRGPSLPMGEAPGHKIAGTILDLKRQAIQRERLAQERLLAEEQARQFGLSQDADAAARAARAKQHAEKQAIAERRAATGEGNLDLGRRQFGMTASEKARQARMSLRPEYAREVEGLVSGLGLPGPLGMRAQQADQERKAGIEPKGPVLGEETIEFDVALGELEQTLEPLLQSDDPVERQAAAMAREQLPGWLKQYGGDKEKAGKAARAFFDGRVQEAGKDRRAAEVTKRMASSGPGEDFRPPDRASGAKEVRDFMKGTGAQERINNYTMSKEIAALMDDPRYRGNTIQSVMALMGALRQYQSANSISDADMKRTTGLSWGGNLMDKVKRGIFGESGEEIIEKVSNFMEGNMSKDIKLLSENWESLQEMRQTLPAGGDRAAFYRRGFESQLPIWQQVLPDIEAYREAQKEEEELRSLEVGAPSAPVAPVDDVQGLIDNAPPGGSGSVGNLGTTEGRGPRAIDVTRGRKKYGDW